MTAPDRTVPAPTDEALRPRGARPAAAPRPGFVLTLAVVAVAAALRLVYVGRSYDLWQDEVDYVVLSTSLRHGTFPPVFPGSGPFLLHPPFFFALGALWQLLLPPGAHFFHLLAEMRVLNALLAAATCGCLYVLGSRLANRATGLSAALLFAVDPYILRQNGRVFLDTNTLLFVLLGYVVFLRVVQRRTGRPYATAVAAGLLLGLGITSKDMGLLLAAPPLVLLTAGGFGVPRRVSGTALVATFVPYGIYVACLTAVGSFGAFWTQETSLFLRFAGQTKATGFSRAGSPSLVHTLLVQLASFGTTYLLVAASLVATLYLLVVTRRTDHRLAAVLSGCGALTVFYALSFGTIEEQFLYYLLAPAILSLAVGVHVWLRRRPSVRSGRRFAAVALGLLVVVSGYDLGTWGYTRAHPDNGEQRLAAWFQHHRVKGGVVNNDSAVTFEMLQLKGVPSVLDGTLAAARRDHVRYLTVLTYESDNNYSVLSHAQVKAFERTGRLVYLFHDATYKNVEIWVPRNPASW